MERSSFLWFLVAVAAIVLLIPGAAGRLFIDLVGGLTLFLLLLLLLGVWIGFQAWRMISQNLKPCPGCGTVCLGGDVCPSCGNWLTNPQNNPRQPTNLDSLDPAQMTINVEAVDVESPANHDE